MSKNNLQEPQCNRKFYQFNKDQYCICKTQVNCAHRVRTATLYTCLLAYKLTSLKISFSRLESQEYFFKHKTSCAGDKKAGARSRSHIIMWDLLLVPACLPPEIIFSKDIFKFANRLEPRSSPTYLGPALGSSLFASGTTFFQKIFVKIDKVWILNL